MDSMLFKMQMVYELNKPDHPIEPTDIYEVISNTIERFRVEMQRYTMTCHISVPAGLKVLSNRALLQIVFRNLLENAIIFRKTEPGLGCFVNITVKENGKNLELSVTDNGIGIKEKYIPRIFELYFRASQASRGNGLGLYLVQKATQKLKGEITIVSDINVGTTFTILLPVTA
jgi:signal transduction histidine kinase